MEALTGMITKFGHAKTLIRLSNGTHVEVQHRPDLVRGMKVEIAFDMTTNTVRDVWEYGTRPANEHPDEYIRHDEEELLLTLDTTPVSVETELWEEEGEGLHVPESWTSGPTGPSGPSGPSSSRGLESSMAVMFDLLLI